MSLLQSNSIQIQKSLAKYKTKKEFAEALYMLRFRLKTPRNVKTLIDWIANMSGKAKSIYGNGSAFFHSEETIAAEIGCSTKTVQRALAWLRKHGFIITYYSQNQDGQRGTDYKVFASYEDVKAMIKALANKQIEAVESVQIDRKVSDRLSDRLSDRSQPENTDIPSDEGPKNGEHVVPLCNTSIKKDIKNRLSADKQASVSNPFKFIKPEIVEIVKSFPWHENEQPKIARKVQKALTDSEKEMNDETRLEIIEALRSAAEYIEKKNVLENPAKKYNYIYQCVKTALNGHLTKHEKKTDESGKVLGVVKHEHYYKTEKKPTLNDYIKAKHGGLDFDDFGNEPERERKILSDDEVIINSDSQPKTTNEGRKIIKSDAKYLPDWFEEDRSEFYKSLEAPKAPTIVSMEAKLNAFRESPRKVNNLW